jgi:hypothetical protein
MSNNLIAYHRTESLKDGKFIAQVEIISAPSSDTDIVDTRLRDDDHPCTTLEEAEHREVQLAEQWKRENAPEDSVIEFRD